MATDGNGRGTDGRFTAGNVGRRHGTTNKLTRSFREAVLTTFDKLGGTKALTKWARENPTEFYRIAAKLIPREVHATVQHTRPLLIDQVTSADVEQARDEEAVH